MGEIIKQNQASKNTTRIFYGLMALFIAEKMFPEICGVTEYAKELLTMFGFWMAKDSNK